MTPKFRAFIKIKNAVNPVQPVGAINFESETITIEQGLTFPFDKAILMQSTGLEDKNGVEIYEGDIVHIFNEEEYQTINMLDIVVFENGSFTTQSFAYDFYNNGGDLLTVKGNIYEHPELMEAQND